MKRVRNFLGLSFTEKRIVCKALCYGWYYRRQLQKRSFRDVVHRVLQRAEAESSLVASDISPERLAWLVDRASRGFLDIKCLPTSLAGHRLFAENGYETTFHIGVCKVEDGQLEAHAWLSEGGKVVVGELPDLANYEELPLTDFGTIE